jgi:creatinine amidohydrolase
MLLHHASWPEVEAYLKRCKGIVIPIGSTEQHGPNGLVGTDAICPEVIAAEAGAESGFLIGPTFNVGIAQHHLAFPGSMTLRPSTMIAALNDWIESLTRHGFDRIYFLNGHGGNITTINAAFAEYYANFSLDAAACPVRLSQRNWWELPGRRWHARHRIGSRRDLLCASARREDGGDVAEDRADGQLHRRRRLSPQLPGRPDRL